MEPHIWALGYRSLQILHIYAISLSDLQKNNIGKDGAKGLANALKCMVLIETLSRLMTHILGKIIFAQKAAVQYLRQYRK